MNPETPVTSRSRSQSVLGFTEARKREQQTASYMKFGCVSASGWDTSKFEDICKKLKNEWWLDVVHEGKKGFAMLGKGRKRKKRSRRHESVIVIG